MSTDDQEARALERAREFLLALSSGRHPARPIRDLRAEARDIARHYPLDVGHRWMSERYTDHVANANTTVNPTLGSHK